MDPEDVDNMAHEVAANSIENISTDQLMAESGKTCVLVELLERLKEEGHQTLVFSQSRKMLDIIQKILKSRGFKVMRIDGTITKLEDRDKRIRRFQSDPSWSVFLLTTQVGGVGLNLTAADRVVIYDPSWNPATDAQAVDRYFSRQDLRELFVMDNPEHSTTQEQLAQMHSQNRKSDTNLDEHIAYLHSLGIFGISDHDLLYTKQADHEELPEGQEYIQQRYEDIVVNGEDWFLVRNIAQIPDDPNAVLLKFHSAKSEKGKQQLPNGKIKVKLGDYFSPAASPWAKLEDFHDPAAFIANFNEMRESIERDEDDEDSMGEGAKATNEESQVHSKGMEDFSVDGEHMAKGAEGESEGTMEGEDDTSDDEFDPKKPKLPSQKVTRKKPKHQETDPETEDEIHGDDGDQEEEVDQRKKKKKTKGSKGRKEKRQIEKCDFREAVEKMRQIHPDVDKVENNMPLNKNALGWRSAVADQQNSTLLNVSSLMATHVAVATLSPRCYQEAQGIMTLWSAGQCRGQGKSRNVKQTIFRELKGQHREEDLFDLLRQLRRGQIDWDDFETRAKAHKVIELYLPIIKAAEQTCKIEYFNCSAYDQLRLRKQFGKYKNRQKTPKVYYVKKKWVVLMDSLQSSHCINQVTALARAKLVLFYAYAYE
uniref:Helicase C-terminal domain-containing protein n=1 Tax=Branchiostoma floridae TaxID=7739 RepID=C3Z7W7_BRAFL|eukprot:XP_002595460.1 hypothetical protein BRAFLDRAFT_69293 [Branchiostoma floridae]